MAGKVVLNIRKNKNVGGLGHHIDRTEGMEHMYKNADTERKHLNKNFELNDFCKMPLHEGISERIAEGYKGKKKLRNDAVKSISIVLGGSHKEMHEIFADKEKRKAWLQNSAKFLASEFGKENIVRFTLHMDERTPHVHASIVPLTKDGRLSAREMIGNNAKMKKIRKNYAKWMKPLGLEYGTERKAETKVSVSKIDDFYTLTDNFEDEYQKVLKTLKTANFKNIKPDKKSKMLEDLQRTLKKQALTQEIFDKYLKKWSAKSKKI